jgi:hypothetical protein
MPFAHIKGAPPVSLHSWGAKCDNYQRDAYDKTSQQQSGNKQPSSHAHHISNEL